VKLHYYPETDSLYIELRAEPGAEVREITEGLNLDLSATGEIIGFDIDNASRRLDLTTLQTVALPLAASDRLTSYCRPRNPIATT
jgi:uncharacterized protein YuzE